VSRIGKARRGTQRRFAGYGMAIVVVVLAVYGIVVSPVFLDAVSNESEDWAFRADVGTAYGGISAILSGLALCGVAASLILQHRQSIVERMAIERERHFDLVSLGITFPELLPAVEPESGIGPNARQETYINLHMGYWMRTVQMGEMDEYDARHLLANMFKGEIARTWWARVHPAWHSHSLKAVRRFAVIVTDEWEQARAVANQAPPT
jgi:hypothetical protein